LHTLLRTGISKPGWLTEGAFHTDAFLVNWVAMKLYKLNI